MAFEPEPRAVITEPARIRCFADPLRVRVLNLLTEREATNQQIADALKEPQAKVLYHLRYLQKGKLIRIVRRRVRGPNVEKFYRAVARSFDLRVTDELRPDILGAELETLARSVTESAWRHPETPPRILIRRGLRTPEEANAFFVRLQELIDAEWSADHGQAGAEPGPDAATHFLGLAFYRSEDADGS
jgi:DNA-binding transcriptional ArsR family regulator